jgi:ABC-type phosphate transport system substrate-binding protein
MGTAAADPPSTPAHTDIVGVGSDTTEDVMNQFSTDYDATAPANNLYSWDATGSPTITPKAGCSSITRPFGSSAGISALLADSSGCLDYARSSRAKKTDGTDGNLLFVEYARDGVTWARSKSSLTPSTLTPAQLQGIYTCTLTNWNQISASLPSNPINAYLPQASSGTRSFFLGAIGVTSVGACVHQPSTLEENNGTALKAQAATDGVNLKTVIAPYSIGKWLAQSKGTSPDNRGGITLWKINGKAPIKNTTHTINKGFPPQFLRFLFNVVKPDGLGHVPARLLPVFGKSTQNGFLCKNPTTISNYGFLSLGSACGTVIS